MEQDLLVYLLRRKPCYSQSDQCLQGTAMWSDHAVLANSLLARPETDGRLCLMSAESDDDRTNLDVKDITNRAIMAPSR